VVLVIVVRVVVLVVARGGAGQLPAEQVARWRSMRVEAWAAVVSASRHRQSKAAKSVVRRIGGKWGSVRAADG